MKFLRREIGGVTTDTGTIRYGYADT